MDDVVFKCAGAIYVPEGIPYKVFNFKIVLFGFQSYINVIFPRSEVSLQIAHEY